jgi:hypothetical protein
VSRSLSRWVDSRWFPGVVLALPYLITLAALRGLTVTLPIFHGSDERVYHLPTIHRFAAELPFPDLVHYNAAQTPLFHLLLAYVGKVTGYEVWRLRLVEVLISYAMAWAVFLLLSRRLRLARGPALALTLLFIVSPYVFGTAFRVMTDNLAILLVVLAVERLERFRQTLRLGPFLAGCAFVALAIFTRQSAAFMLAMAGLYALLLARTSPARLAAALVAVALAAVPAGLLFLAWHGLVPPGADPSSCGLCGSGSGLGRQLSVQTVEMALAVLGLYGSILFAPELVEALRTGRANPRSWMRHEPHWAYAALGAAALGVLVLLIWPARPGPVAHSAGLIWNAARHIPAIDGTSLVFWVLVPLAGIVAVVRLRVSPARWLPATFFGCFLLGALTIRLPWQKYVDPFVLLALMFTVRRDELGSPRQLIGAAVLAAGSLAYAISLAS